MQEVAIFPQASCNFFTRWRLRASKNLILPRNVFNVKIADFYLITIRP